ncbi:MAG: hypothetical protein V4467_01270 [Patescibacteria group bacterium]
MTTVISQPPQNLARLAEQAVQAELFSAEDQGTHQERARAKEAAPRYHGEITRQTSFERYQSRAAWLANIGL